jgi:signal transduction histidine kinase
VQEADRAKDEFLANLSHELRSPLTAIVSWATLDVSRIITGKLRLNLEALDLPNAVQSAVDAIQPTAEAKGVRLQVTVDPSAGAVIGDPDRLQQIFWNLLSNAIKFTPKNGRVQVLSKELIRTSRSPLLIVELVFSQRCFPTFSTDSAKASRVRRDLTGASGLAWLSCATWSSSMAAR